MILWLDVLGALLILASAIIWVVRYVQASHGMWEQLDRHSLPDDQLGL